MIVDENLAQQLVTEQFPEWAKLPIRPVAQSGWDNRTFHLGEELSIRIPSDEKYAPQILKEYQWLPQLAENVAIDIATPIALGEPSGIYPWHWSVNKWIEGEAASNHIILSANTFANDLGRFLREFEQIKSDGGPTAGGHNFYRGGCLSVYSEEMAKALANIIDEDLRELIRTIWEKSLSSTWSNEPIWVHGDLAQGNILVQDGKLKAVIDFGQLAIGDPACDFVMSWNFFDEESRAVFRKAVDIDKDTWIRSMGWALWKTVCWPIKETNTKKVISEICRDYQNNFS